MGTILIVVAGLIGAAIWFKRNKNNDTKRPTTSQKNSSVTTKQTQFASVALQCSDQACKSAVSMRGTPLLASEAPVLPLAGCDSNACKCAYQKVADRREEGRRTADHGIQPLIFDGEENRDASDRRAS